MLLLSLPGCADRSPPNVVLVVVDTLAAGHVGAWGSPEARTPHIDRLTRAGVCFASMRSTSSWTLPAVASLLTGRYPSRHGATNFNTRLSPSVPYAPEMFAAAGYVTAGFVSHSLVGSSYGFQRGFDRFQESRADTHARVTSAQITKAASVWLWERRGSSSREPFFLLCHYFDPPWVYREHTPYLPRPTPFDPDQGQATDLARYVSEIGHTDRHVGQLLRTLEAVGELDSAILAFVADHGESFGAHGHFGHTDNLYEEIIHVPCALVAPGRLPARLDDRPRSLVDLLPTILELCGLPAEREEMQGRSVTKERSGRDVVWSEVSWKPYRVGGRSPGPDDSPDRTLRAVISSGFKVVTNVDENDWQIYDLAKDPAESEDLAPTNPELLARYRALLQVESDRLETSSEVAVEDVELSEEVLGNLRSLGYVD